MGSHNAGQALYDLHGLAAQVCQPHACQRQSRLKESSQGALSNIAQHLLACDTALSLRYIYPQEFDSAEHACGPGMRRDIGVALPFMSMIQMDLPPGTVSLSKTSYI